MHVTCYKKGHMSHTNKEHLSQAFNACLNISNKPILYSNLILA